MGTTWTEMRRHNSIIGSPVLVYPRRDHHSALLRPGGHAASALLILEPLENRVIFEMNCDPASEPARTTTLLRNLKRIEKVWPTVEYSRKDSVHFLRETLLGFSLTDRGPWEAHFNWVEQRTVLLRAFFGPTLDAAVNRFDHTEGQSFISRSVLRPAAETHV